jgi:starch phosphorylase
MESAQPPSHHQVNQFNLPRRIRRLADLAYNLWWTWNGEAERLFRLLDRVLWERAEHNPVRFLREISRDRLNDAIRDRYYLESYDRVIQAFDVYMNPPKDTWYNSNKNNKRHNIIAYFSTEFGLHETLPIYAGGLGVLSGDHLKESSDLDLPLVAVGFLYTEGYFKQRITEDGWQEAIYASLSFPDLPVHPVVDEEGDKITIDLMLAGRQVKVCLWRVQVGRVPLFLLDSNVEGNAPADRTLTARLYTNELDQRISQEIILGIGGVRALRLMGYNPTVWHMNEGHSGFLILERLREQIASGREFEEASKIVRMTTAFTTHTPVPAGHDEFPLWLIDKYFNSYWPQLGLDRDSFIDLARQSHPWGEAFSMTILAIEMSGRCNGVSELHGHVAREMWSFLWPGKAKEEVPISHITNGIHTGTWIARRLRILFDEYFEADWTENIDDPATWAAVERIPDTELWEIRRHLKRKLVAYMRERARLPWSGDRIHPVQVIASGVLLDPYAFTIGFARRFATYKRANLILRDPDRLLRIIGKSKMPVQIIFAGKAHPADEPGKRLIQELYRVVKRAEFGGRLVFLEDYDINLARYLIQGVDLWLNTPRRPKEASGTSGQKAALNGVLNFSVLDGWWREGYNGRNGWAIGEDREWDDPEAQDAADAESLYETLEEEIIPLFYERSGDGLPSEWLGWMKESIITLAPRFSMRRMVKDYANEIYLPSISETNKVNR